MVEKIISVEVMARMSLMWSFSCIDVIMGEWSIGRGVCRGAGSFLGGRDG